MKPMNRPRETRLEDDLLVSLARIIIDVQRTEKIKLLLRNNIDWPYLIQMALRHGVVPLLYRNLKSIQPEAIPGDVLDQLRKYFLVNVGRNLFLNEELIRLLNLFASHGIQAIPYKGPVLAASIYGDIALRQFSDLDILVQKQDVFRCQDIMVSGGYQSNFQVTDVNEKHYLQSRNELSFKRIDGRVVVELQWEIVPPYFNFSIPAEYLWNNVQDSAGGDFRFQKLSPEIELIIICVHGAKDLWARLLWVCDVAEFIRVNKELNWDWVIRLSRTLGGLRMLSLGLLLAKKVLDISLPDKVIESIESDPAAMRLAREVKQQIFDGSNGSCGILQNSLFYLKVRECVQDRIQYCARLAMTITPGDWSLVPLPKSLFPLYHLMRPVRLGLKYGLKSLKSICSGRRLNP